MGDSVLFTFWQEWTNYFSSSIDEIVLQNLKLNIEICIFQGLTF